MDTDSSMQPASFIEGGAGSDGSSPGTSKSLSFPPYLTDPW